MIGVLLASTDAYGHDTSQPTKNALAWASGSGALMGGVVGFSAGYTACISTDCDAGMSLGLFLLPTGGFISGSIIGGINGNRKAGGSRSWSIAASQLATVTAGTALLTSARSDSVAYAGAALIVLGPVISSSLLGYYDKSATNQSLTFTPILTDDQQGLALSGSF